VQALRAVSERSIPTLNRARSTLKLWSFNVNHLPRTIAAYSLLKAAYYYWNATTQAFDLKEVAPGTLEPTNRSPFKHIRTDREDLP
jgi:hypothetical protein